MSSSWNKHLKYKIKSFGFFKIKLGKFKRPQNAIKYQTNKVNENGTLASYEVPQLIAKSDKSHTMGLFSWLQLLFVREW